MIDVKTITDIVRPITNTLADVVAPVHPELIIVVAAKKKKKKKKDLIQLMATRL